MGMGRRKHRQDTLWVATAELPRTAGHVFYERVNRILNEREFDRFVEDACEKFYAAVMGRPSLAPGKYFRMLLVGYFEGIDSERGIAWRCADSLSLREFLGVGLSDAVPDHSTVSRTRRLIDRAAIYSLSIPTAATLQPAGFRSCSTVVSRSSSPAWATRRLEDTMIDSE